jgi:hypothetical protein
MKPSSKHRDATVRTVYVQAAGGYLPAAREEFRHEITKHLLTNPYIAKRGLGLAALEI